MEIILYKNASRKKPLDEAIARKLKKGEVGVLPTETVYGLSAVYDDKKAIAKIRKIKNRKQDKKMPVIAADIDMVEKFFIMDALTCTIAKKYWPGPLSIVLTTRKKRTNYAVRVSSLKPLKKIIGLIGKPVLSTSANMAGKSPVKSLSEFQKYFRDNSLIDFFFDYGVLPSSKPSTVIKINKEKIVVIRQGAIKIK